jgi:GDP-mannose 6-dehydrogenase
MRISVFGLGYVGIVSAGCLANDNHEVIGVDVQQIKVEMINKGQNPIIEKDIGGIIEKAVQTGRLKATMSSTEAIANTDISFVCVGTPSLLNGNLDLRHLRRVCETIGDAIKQKTQRHVVVIRSTILPGTMTNVVIPTLEEHSGKKAGQDFGLCNNPEFLREGMAVYDFYNPPKIVIGELDKESGDLVALIYKNFDAPLIRTKVEIAEIVKYVDNIWHALKIGFGNEVGNICKVMGIDGHRVMEIFCQDTKLNISPAYLKPGFAFGGSCLPKDLRALTYKARMLDLQSPILNAIIPSNEMQMQRGLQMVIEKGNKRIGILGLSFKSGTDDLRESPMVELVERLIGKGYEIKIYDRNVKLASLVGANRDYILNHIPHISRLLTGTVDDVLDGAETIVIGNADPEFGDIFSRIKDNQSVIDFARISNSPNKKGKYEGISW